MRHLLFLATILLTLAMAMPCPAGQSPAAGEAKQVIENLNATLLACMQKGESLGFKGRYAMLEPVMRKAFFYEFMVRKSTGSFWEKLEPARQRELLTKYITWSVGTYARRFSHYKGQRFTIIDSRSVRDRYVKVTCRITRPEKNPRDLTYILIRHNGKWMIVDIQVEGVSQLALTRSQFKSVLKKEGINGLLGILDKKIEKLEKNG